MKALKRIALGSLLFLSVVLMGACATKTTSASTVSADDTTTTELYQFTVEIITAGDDPETEKIETEYVSNSVVITFTEDDEFMDLLRENFTVYCADANGGKDETCSYDSGFGRYLVAIDTLDSTTITNGFISFYIDGVSSMTGIDATEMETGKVYSFKLETY